MEAVGGSEMIQVEQLATYLLEHIPLDVVRGESEGKERYKLVL
jgi:hypothetical protein